jgi:hypothetical protein
VPLPNVAQSLKGFLDVLGSLDLGGEHVPDHARRVYDLGHPTRKDAQGVGNYIQLPHSCSFVAKQGKKQVVLFGESTIRFYGAGAYPDDLPVVLICLSAMLICVMAVPFSSLRI